MFRGVDLVTCILQFSADQLVLLLELMLEEDHCPASVLTALHRNFDIASANADVSTFYVIMNQNVIKLLHLLVFYAIPKNIEKLYMIALLHSCLLNLDLVCFPKDVYLM